LAFLALALGAVVHVVLQLAARLEQLSPAAAATAGLRSEKAGFHRILGPPPVAPATAAALNAALAAKEAQLVAARAELAAARAAGPPAAAPAAQLEAARAELATARAELAAARAAAPAAPAPRAAPAAAPAGRVGLQRLLTDAELDESFRIRSELDSQAMGTADAEMLLPFLRVIYGEHRSQRGRGLEGAGGFVDVGANIGDVSEGILGAMSDHARRFYLHGLSPPGGALPPLVDPVHPVYEDQKVAFVYALEPANATRALLERRALFGAWAVSNFRLFPFAAAAVSGTATFCAHNSGSGQSALTGSENGGIFGDPQGAAVKRLEGEVKCGALETVTLVDLLDARGDITKGRNARVFLLKVDVEGAEAVVLAGAAPLFAAKRVSYVLFENHAKWRATQEAIGVAEFVSVGDVVQRLVDVGYKCAYVTPWGLMPFETKGTPSGDKGFPGCNEGLPQCARHRLYNRQVWSNILCAATPEEDLFVAWLSEALLSPYRTREEMLCGHQQKTLCSKLK